MADRWIIARCDSPRCEAPVIYAVTAKGKRMPVDPYPSPDGTVELRDTGGPIPVAAIPPAHLRFGRTNLHTSHFATCPDASFFRRRRTVTS